MNSLELSCRPRVEIGVGRDVGRAREGKPNEDYVGIFSDYCQDPECLAAKGLLFVLADGMGGAAGGAVASKAAVEVVGKTYYGDPDPEVKSSLRRAIDEASAHIHLIGQTDPALHGLGTTLVAAVVLGHDLVVAHVGDSRAYQLREGELFPLTLDHTVVQEQLREGLLTPEEATTHPRRHALSRNLGFRAWAEPDFLDNTLLKGDTILLCSDGLWGAIDDEEIEQLLQHYHGQAAVDILIERANQNGGPDNISAILVDFDGFAAVSPPPELDDLTPSRTESVAPITRPVLDEPVELPGESSPAGVRLPSNQPAGQDEPRVAVATSLVPEPVVLQAVSASETSPAIVAAPDMPGVGPAAPADLAAPDASNLPQSSAAEQAAGPLIIGQASPARVEPPISGADAHIDGATLPRGSIDAPVPAVAEPSQDAVQKPAAPRSAAARRRVAGGALVLVLLLFAFIMPRYMFSTGTGGVGGGEGPPLAVKQATRTPAPLQPAYGTIAGSATPAASVQPAAAATASAIPASGSPLGSPTAGRTSAPAGPTRYLPTATPTNTRTRTPTPSPTRTPTATPSNAPVTPTMTLGPTPSGTPAPGPVPAGSPGSTADAPGTSTATPAPLITPADIMLPPGTPADSTASGRAGPKHALDQVGRPSIRPLFPLWSYQP